MKAFPQRGGGLRAALRSSAGEKPGRILPAFFSPHTSTGLWAVVWKCVEGKIALAWAVEAVEVLCGALWRTETLERDGVREFSTGSAAPMIYYEF